MSGLPKAYEVRVKYERRGLADAPAELRRKLGEFRLPPGCKPGQTVAVTGGSRGITGIVGLMRTLIAFLKEKGLRPFVVPAMGSHGGATAEGQKRVLADLGMTEETVGTEIRSSVETVIIGTSPDGVAVHQDRLAHEADWVVVMGRVKRHTGFTGPTGSGLLKMMAIGLGKPAGAQMVHSFGPVLGYEKAILSAGRKAVEETRVLFAVGIVEDAYGDTAELKVCAREDMERTDKELMVRALAMMSKIPVDDVDLLIVDWMGKNISGTGMDTHTIGRLRTLGAVRPERPRVKRIFVRDLTEHSEGNAIGIGLADFTTDRLVAKMDYAATCTNGLTAMTPEQSQIPVHYASDRECIERAIASVGAVPTEGLRIIRIANTSHLAQMTVSEAVARELAICGDVEVGAEVEWKFDGDGNLC